uniref:Uncharacterized protein n=1 Tax=Spongospora subterranea TaxID=70186 RepID=A0A0H5QPY3_9EUKA|eukprot:CRZ04103.1 hypothetical protein [Spongospora subterranea]
MEILVCPTIHCCNSVWTTDRFPSGYTALTRFEKIAVTNLLILNNSEPSRESRQLWCLTRVNRKACWHYPKTREHLSQNADESPVFYSLLGSQRESESIIIPDQC